MALKDKIKDKFEANCLKEINNDINVVRFLNHCGIARIHGAAISALHER